MSGDARRAVVQRLFDEVWGQGNLALIEELFAPEYIDHSAPPGVPNQGPDNHRQLIEMLRSAFPDITNTLEEIVVEGNTVAFRNTLRGTHQGQFMGMEPTGRSFVQAQMHFVHFSEDDNKMVEHWGARDDLGMMQQLGVIPSPEQFRGEDVAEIAVMNSADGTQRRNLTDSAAYEDSPAFSPDGKRIVFSRFSFSRTTGENSDIFVMRADGNRPKKLTDTRAFEWAPNWQPLPQ